ncbi:hypothetical protein I302_102662 [Kwoniella bestiolae CBS 10118]|uniref:Uncharacterized protein n=1 Tax=Kwoniella bestiolae CBS 10118 TaxID=1296100 RepID=A0A1B9GFL9_9TREE|nr:hypothetical protein I302_01356 [Kwoniella bestiolae CBS 10118]OCF29843.1 hypothetical protein I302_01356 [Kwoniella bestiolae CBS 10118]
MLLADEVIYHPADTGNSTRLCSLVRAEEPPILETTVHDVGGDISLEMPATAVDRHGNSENNVVRASIPGWFIPDDYDKVTFTQLILKSSCGPFEDLTPWDQELRTRFPFTCGTDDVALANLSKDIAGRIYNVYDFLIRRRISPRPSLSSDEEW